MDYEKILFDLHPILNTPVSGRKLDEDSQRRYLSVLDRLAVCLRSEHNRTIAGSSGLLKRILEILEEVLAECFHDVHLDAFWWKFTSDLIRCVANCLVDNDINRKILFEEKEIIMDHYVGSILTLKAEGNEELQLRTLAMTRNMCLDSEEYNQVFCKIQYPLLDLLHRQNDESLILIGSGVLVDFLKVEQSISLKDLQFFAETIWNQSKKVRDRSCCEQDDHEEDNTLDDAALEVLANFTQCLETLMSEERHLDFDDSTIYVIQTYLLRTLDELWPKQFENKLIHMRRLMTCIGHISAQKRNTNKKERGTCYQVICESSNGYKIGAAFIILSNSINSSSDASIVAGQISLQQLIKAASCLTDPMQIQGFLAICKKLLNVSSAMEVNSETIRDLSFVLDRVNHQSAFCNDLLPLLDALLKKIFTVLPSSTVHDSLSDINSPLLAIIKDRDSIISCLALDKLLISSKVTSTDITGPLWQTACKFEDNVISCQGQVSIFYIFQLAKTFGILLKNLENNNEMLQDSLKPWIIRLLELIKSLKDKNDQASQSAVNNGKFIATLLLRSTNRSSGTNRSEQDERLEVLAREFF